MNKETKFYIAFEELNTRDCTLMGPFKNEQDAYEALKNNAESLATEDDISQLKDGLQRGYIFALKSIFKFEESTVVHCIQIHDD